MTDKIDHKVTRQALTEQATAFIADPSGWPAAMAARALRVRSGHPPYSPNNQVLILTGLMTRFVDQGMTKSDAIAAAIEAGAEELAPRHVWAKRGYVPTPGTGLPIISRPIPMWVNMLTGKKCDRDDEQAIQKTVFRVEHTYRASDVIDGEGNTAAQGEYDQAAPELPQGQAREVFERLTEWITKQGWTVTRSGYDWRVNGWTDHGTRSIVVHGGLADWAAVETLTHEIAHALLHGQDETRTYAGEHRGDMEAEAEAVAFGLLTAYGQGELARGSARYAAEWTRNPDRVAIAYEQASHVLDAVAAVAFGAHDVRITQSAKAAKAAAKTENKALAAELRKAGLDPKGEAWKRAKAGEPIHKLVAELTPSA